MTGTRSPAPRAEPPVGPPIPPAGDGGPGAARRARIDRLRRLGQGAHALVVVAAAGIVALLAAFVLLMGNSAWSSIVRYGPEFLTGQTWDPVHGVYGAGPAVAGTLATSALALLFAVPVALGAALFLTEFAPRRLRRPLGAVVDLSAAVPSVVWGLWAILVIAPWLEHSVEPALAGLTGGAGPFSRTPTGFDVLSASVVLAIMVLPTISALSRTALESVPRAPREAALALGANRSESVAISVLRPARPGIAAAILLGFARAAGEAIIVVSLLGNIYTVPTSLFAQGETIAGQILNDLNSGAPAERGPLVELGLLLLVLTMGINLAARALLRSVGPRSAGRAGAPSRRSARIARAIRGLAPGVLETTASAAAAGGRGLRASSRWAVRQAKSAGITILCAGATGLAVVPLASVIATAIARGGSAVIRPSFYTSELPPACVSIAGSSCPIGGIGPAIQGTILLLALASLIAVPAGLAAGIYLSEYGRGVRAGVVRLATDLLLGIPSVLIGLFVVLLLIDGAPQLDNTALAGGAALSILMLPLVTRATEEALRAVPVAARESATALGFPRHRTTARIVLPAARGGLVTGIFLAVARAGGETAAVVLTAFGSPYWFAGLNHPIAALSLVIFQQGTESSYANWQSDAWGAALVLLGLMLAVSLLSHYLVRGRPASEGAP